MYEKAIEVFVSTNRLDPLVGLISSIESVERQNRMCEKAVKKLVANMNHLLNTFIFSFRSVDRQNLMYQEVIKECVLNNKIDQLIEFIFSFRSVDRRDFMIKEMIKELSTKEQFQAAKECILQPYDTDGQILGKILAAEAAKFPEN